MPFSDIQKRRENKRLWREKNKDRILEYNRIYLREWRKRNPTKQPEYDKKKDKQKVAARDIANKAIRAGVLIRPDKCSPCGEIVFTEAHHTDYAQPLSVQWLCRTCRREADRAIL